MKGLLRFLTQKWLISTIGLIALVLLIWFGGPYLGLGEARPLVSSFNRLVVVFVVVLVWGLNNLRLQVKASKANNQMIDQLAVPAQAPLEVIEDASVEELNILKERFEQALQRLKKTSFHGKFGKQYLYELPWYIIIGPPGSGKTTLLENAGLEFPLAEENTERKIRGVGGTRNCDWWFTNDAVLLDTAGRYTTQDSDVTADSGAWLGFLDMLRKNRPRRPLNGVLIAVSLEDLLRAPEQDMELHANAVRQRVQELYSRLGTRFPVYFLFTKCDLISGFSEYFDDLGLEQRAQVWGMTFPKVVANASSNEIDEFRGEFDHLVTRLNARLLYRLYEERDLARRGLINGFPQQMASLKPMLEDFLAMTFKRSRYEEAIWLRGVYLTSGTQQGSPVDRVMGALASSFGLSSQTLPAYTGRPKAFFINRLFRDVVFQEAELAGANIRYERQRLWLQRGAYAGAVGLTAAVVVAWSASFTRNEIQINRLENRIDAFNDVANQLGPHPTLGDIQRTLDYAKDVSRVYGAEPEKTPWLMGMGLYQGFKLGAAAERAYERILQQSFLPLFKARLEGLIRRASVDPEELRRLLSLYYMLGEPQTLDASRFKTWVMSDWEKTLPNDAETRSQLAGHLDTLLTTDLHSQVLDQPLLENAQAVVCDIPLPRQIYARLQQRAGVMGLSGFNLDKLGRDAKKVLVSGSRSRVGKAVSGFYTYTGFHEIVDEEGRRTAELTIEENARVCIHKRDELEKADPDQLMRDVRKRYFADYVDSWKAFLDDVGLVNLSNLQQGVEALDRLSGHDSPLETLIKAVVEHTQLERKFLGSLLEKTEIDEKLGVTRQPSNPVEREFQPYHRLLQPLDKDPAPLESIRAQLNELFAYASEIAEASEPTEAAFEAAKARMTEKKKDIIRQMRIDARGLPVPVDRILSSIATQTWGTVLGSARGYVNAIWRSTVLRAYQAGLESRYPLNMRGRQQVTLSDFGAFFGEGGSVDNFMNAYLVPFVDTRRWRLRTLDDRSLGLSSSALKQMRRAAIVKAMFFADGGDQPLLRFSLTPTFLDAKVKRFVLNLNEQQLVYQHGPLRTRDVEWPGPGERDQVRVAFEHLSGSRFTITKEGPWAWFKLLDESTIDRLRSADKINITFETAGLKARYKLDAGSVTNPFTSDALVNFSCPERL